MQTADDKAESRNAIKELLLEDYRNFSESLWKNEQTGETRVNWFIGIVTAATGGLVGLTTSEQRPHGGPLRLIFVATLFAMFSFGIITLLRIMKRNRTTDEYKENCDQVRQMFKNHFDMDEILKEYQPFGKRPDQKLARKLGGLAHTVLTINSLLLAGIVAAFIYPFGRGFTPDDAAARLSWTYVGALAVFCVAAVCQYFWIRYDEKKPQKQ